MAPVPFWTLPEPEINTELLGLDKRTASQRFKDYLNDQYEATHIFTDGSKEEVRECYSICKENITNKWQKVWEEEQRGRRYYSCQRSVTNVRRPVTFCRRDEVWHILTNCGGQHCALQRIACRKLFEEEEEEEGSSHQPVTLLENNKNIAISSESLRL
ncbi:hypothetical protein WMY93_030973 [Mugilogobius chulae]|uniref:Uncharacterized protein n=1 Tax=Mugilogobius chulae TaxID=88201 RepID=A0AAW0MKL7_9GOBI